MSVRIEKIAEFKHADLTDLVQATDDAIRDGIGFNWVLPPGVRCGEYSGRAGGGP